MGVRKEFCCMLRGVQFVIFGVTKGYGKVVNIAKEDNVALGVCKGRHCLLARGGVFGLLISTFMDCFSRILL